MSESALVQKALRVEEKLNHLGLELDFTDNAFLIRQETEDGYKIFGLMTSIDGIYGFIDGWEAARESFSPKD